MTSPDPRNAARAQRFYTRWASLYDLLARATPGVRTVRDAAVSALALEPGDVVVEMGCGTGANFPFLRERVGPTGTVVGVDFAPGMLACARQRVEDAGWENVHVVRGDATRPPVARADALLASFVVGMLPDPSASVREWVDRVEPGGRLALLDLARSTRPAGRPLNALFRGLVVASSPSKLCVSTPQTRQLDRRVAAAHRTLRAVSTDVTHSTHTLGFVRVSAGRVVAE